MKSETKIFLDKKDELDKVVSYIEETSAEEVIVNFPKNSQIGMSVAHFKTLKKTAEQLGKQLMIESIDDVVLDLAKEANIKAVNPIFKSREKITDIITRNNTDDENAETEEDAEEEPQEKHSLPFNRILWIAGTLIILAVSGLGGFELTTKILPKAQVSLILEKKNFDFEENIEISSKATQPDFSDETKIIIPGELLTAKKNLEMKFPSTGKKSVETKATGFLTVYTNYDNKLQVLVASTRFQSPDGKIFRLNEQIIVPGAKTENGKLTPLGIEVAVTADKTGDEYNLPPTALWKIPGFEGTPRYQGFYAESKSAMSGGFKGEVAGLGDEDLKKAKEDVAKTLKDVLKGQMIIALKTGFKLMDEASSFKVVKIEPQFSENDAKNFSLWGEGQMKQLIFDEKTLKNAIVEKIKKSAGENFRLKDLIMKYGEIKVVALEDGKLDFKVAGSAVLEYDVNVNELKNKIFGADEKEFRATIFNIKGLEKANLLLSPFWVRNIPENPSKVEIITQ